jgi:addiction module RelE/StbE family toxin
MARINWTDQSIANLTNIADFIAKDSVRYARITVSRIRNAVKLLKTYPLSGRMVPEADIEEVREIILGNYRIIYHVFSSEHIDILTVHHSARRLEVENLVKKV